MLMTPRLAAYLFKIMQMVKEGKYVEALRKCPECDTEIATWDDATSDHHIVIKQKTGDTELYYCVVGCEGYWVVDPKTLGFPRGNWSPTYEIIKQRLAKYAKKKMGWDLKSLDLEEDNRKELAVIVKDDPDLDKEDKIDLLSGLEDDE